MWARLTAILGEYISRAAVREAAQEVATKFGINATRKAASQLSTDLLKNGTKQEIVEAVGKILTSSGKEGISDSLFKKSNAKKLADAINGGIDTIENRTRKFLEAKSLGMMEQRVVDMSDNPTIRALRSMYGLKNPVRQQLTGFRATRAYRAARNTFSDVLEASLFPTTSKQAFGVYYARGVLGESTANLLNSALLGTPRAAIASPKVRAFVRTMQAEIKYLRQAGQVRSAAQIQKALKNATATARNLYGPQDPLYKSKIAGYVSGRLTVPVATTFVFVDGDERKKNVEKLKNSVAPYSKKMAKEKIKTYVDSYTRGDGTRVRGHYRQLEVAKI